MRGILAATAGVAALLASTAQAANEETTSDTEAPGVAEVVVTARAAKLYRTDEVATSKLETAPLAASQMVTVITADLIRDQGARDAQDLYRNISGVSVFSYAGVTARGFRQQENFYDGLRGDPYIGFSVPQLFNIERVEFLKGPAGMLYGQTAPGGLFNYVTKKPSRDFAASVAAVAGTESRYGARGEITGPVGEVLALRGGVFFEDRDLPRTFADNRSLILDGGATLDLGGLKFTGQALRIEQDLQANRLRGVPVDNAGRFLASRRWNHNEPSDFLDLRSTSFQLRADWDVTEDIKLDAAVRRIDAEETQNYHEPIALLDADRNGVFDGVARQYRSQIRDTGTTSYAANGVWSRAFSDAVSNRLLIGVDYSKSHQAFDSASLTGRATATAGLPCPLTFANPVYGACDPRTYALAALARDVTGSERTGVYVLNELTLGRFIVTGGVRRDTFEDESSPATGLASRFKGDDTTYRVGGVWRLRDDVSVFAQFATSFEPQGAAAQDPRAGGPFPPTTGDIVEGGLKTALMGGRLQTALALYRIRRENLLQSDPRGDVEGDGVNNSIAFGEVTSEGLDLDVAADITRDWVLTMTYAYNNTRITKDNGRTAITNAVPGGRFANAPRHKLGFWTRYQWPDLGLAVALGGDYVSRRISLSNQTIDPYVVWDGSVSYTRGPCEFRLRVDNLFDKTYAASGFNDRGGHFPGEPRSAFLEAEYRF